MSTAYTQMCVLPGFIAGRQADSAFVLALRHGRGRQQVLRGGCEGVPVRWHMYVLAAESSTPLALTQLRVLLRHVHALITGT